MQQKSPSIELEVKTMEKHYVAPYICAAVYFLFFVVSCVYLYIHSRRKPAAKPGVFALGPMAEAGNRGRGAASAEAAPAVVEMDDDLPRRSGSNTPLAPVSPADTFRKSQSKREEVAEIPSTGQQ